MRNVTERLFRHIISSVLLFSFLSGVAASAEIQNSFDPKTSNETHLRIDERRFFDDLVGGQKAIWTSPFRTQSHDLLWVAPLAGITALMFTKDAKWSNSLEPSITTLDNSKKISYLGSAPATFATAAAVYFIGKLTDNDRAKAAGFLGLEALVHTSMFVQSTKLLTRRERPQTGDEDGSFWSKGNSFPSGHSASIWSLAAVFSGIYPHNKFVQVGAYSIATAVTVSRVTGENHFVSDVLVGSTVGYLIGRMVVKQHTVSSQESKLQSMTPYVDRTHGKYGLNVFLHW